ncbi:MAG: response regulator SirA, partial [Candidatus Hodarchaeales archaeon]
CNGALAYELPIHKKIIGDKFLVWAKKFKSDKDRQDAFIRADRVRRLFSEIEPATQEEIDEVAQNSLLREFIGGSSRKY